MDLVFAVVIGLALGSFCTVLIARVPAGENWTTERSACRNCGSALRWWHNIPLVSWMVLRGRCSRCSARISWRYPAVEVASAALTAGVYLTFGFTALAVGLVVFCVVTLALVFIDFDTMRLPNTLTLPLYPIMATAIAAQAFMEADASIVFRAVLGVVILGGAYGILWFAFPAGMGFGDVKLAGVLGMTLAAISWQSLAVGAILAPLLGGVFGVGLALVRGRLKGLRIPYGPWLIFGAWAGLFFGSSLATWYINLVLGT